MTDKEVFSELLDWIYKKFPKIHMYYFETENPLERKKLARRMLKLRVRIEPSILTDLSDELRSKIGYEGKLSSKIMPPLLVRKLIAVLNRDKKRVVFIGVSNE